MEYQFRDIEKKWQAHWKQSGVYHVSNESDKPKYYVLDMFPYPSGAGLHVGHPLGYIASDIYSRFKRLKGFNVLHPMGYDAFGLPAEQYAIDHGIHPAVSTENNITNFRRQLDNIGFCYDWNREVRTCEPSYYKWTQWIFLQLFGSYYNRQTRKAEPITELVKVFEQNGNAGHPCPGDASTVFDAAAWKGYDFKQQQEILMHYRLSYCGFGEVNWCEALGTVLANDEVVNGVSERGGHPVVKKKLRQWYLRITEYADRLLEGLQTVDFSDAMKEMQTNWIGKSEGAEISFKIESGKLKVESGLRVYTTRPDTIFGVDFMVIAPEHALVETITTSEHKETVEQYIAWVKSRSERERMAEKKISGVFTGAYAVNPFDGRQIPIWISEYVLAGYGTGAIMAVPCGDERDHKFAKYFNIPVTNIIGSFYNGEEANPTKEAVLENSGFLNGMLMKDAIGAAINAIEEKEIGTRKVNFKMRDAAFSRQRYWGEPFPVQWKDGVAYPLSADALPLELPHVDSYKPGPEGEGPLANIDSWTASHYETNTMPGYAGSSWYFLRYMDPANDKTFCDRKVSDYWGQVDLYIGGTEHAVGHLLYSRMWTKCLYDLGYIGFDEPFRKLVNQGMIQGSSRFVYRVHGKNLFVSAGLKDQYSTDALHVDVNIVDGYELNTEEFVKWRNAEFAGAEFILEDGSLFSPQGGGQVGAYICGSEVEKMSKSKFNTVNPDDLVIKYGADTFRMYEMFLGPVEMSKPWDTKGIEGVHRFLKKCWRLFADETKGWIVTDEAPTPAELKVLHQTIKKTEQDTERFSFNTGVSGFMIAVNELNDLNCHKRAILEPLCILLTPYAPHICEEIWHRLGNSGSVLDASFPVFNPAYVAETSKAYPVAINGKTRTELTIALTATQAEVEQLVLADTTVQKWLEGKSPKKIIYVKNKMINVVI
ncbi:MAG: leucine--tRNA ligase [Chitinophagaceae bacterium]|nr:leucine--tRNA ligase [Chitinophagaceae bacterium]